jgi:hypothetical protein
MIRIAATIKVPIATSHQAGMPLVGGLEAKSAP